MYALVPMAILISQAANALNPSETEYESFEDIIVKNSIFWR